MAVTRFEKKDFGCTGTAVTMAKLYSDWVMLPVAVEGIGVT